MRGKILFSLIILLIGIILISNYVMAASAWSLNLHVKLGTADKYDRIFGTSTTATDNYDIGIDIPRPPMPPSGTEDVYFYEPTYSTDPNDGKDKLGTDMKAIADIKSWVIKFKVPSGTTLNVSWGAISFPASALDLVPMGSYGTSTINMLTTKSIIITAGLDDVSQTYSINYTNQVQDITPPYFTTIPAATTISYGQGFSAQFAATDASLPITWSIDDTKFQISSSGLLSNIGIIAAGKWQINVTITDAAGNKNSTKYNVTINPIVGQTSLTLDKISPQVYETSIRPTCGIIRGQGSAALKLNSNIISSGVDYTLGVGTWNLNCSYAGNENYSQSSNLSQFTISKKTATLDMAIVPAGWQVGNGTQTTVQGTGCPSQLDSQSLCKLYRVGVNVANPHVYNNLAVGSYTYVYNTTGNENYSSVSSVSRTLTVTDSSLLIINANSPLEGKIYTNKNIQFSVYSSNKPDQLDTCIYSLDNFVTNNSMARIGINFNATKTLNDGSYTVNFWCNDTSKFTAATLVHFSIDTIAPSARIIYPVNSLVYTSQVTELNYSITGASSCRYSIDGTNWNFLDCSLTRKALTSTEGSNTWRIQANDSAGNVNSSIVTFTYTLPVIPTFNVTLSSGINFIGIPMNLADTSISNITAGNENKIRAIYTYSNGWKMWYPGLSIGNLRNVEAGKGYIIITSEGFDLKLTGLVTGTYPSQVSLSKGWSLFTARNSLASLNLNYSKVFAYDKSSSSYRDVPDTEVLNSGIGYWIYMNSSQNFNF